MFKKDDKARTCDNANQEQTSVNNEGPLILRRIPSDLCVGMSAVEMSHILGLSDDDYVDWLIQHYEPELQEHAQALACKYAWWEKKYGDHITPWLLLQDAKVKFRAKATMFATYGCPLQAMRRAMSNMVIDIGRPLRRSFGLELHALRLDAQDGEIDVPSRLLGADAHIGDIELLHAVAAVCMKIPKEHWTGYQYLVLHKVHGMAFVDIAKAVNVCHTTIMRRMNRARIYIREQLVICQVV